MVRFTLLNGLYLFDSLWSRYFSLAHEIAHNLVQPHNAEHEFWFSSICEKFMPAFAQLLTGPTQ